MIDKENINYPLTEDEFKTLYMQYAPTMIFFARKYVDNSIAEDIVHDVFLKIWDGNINLSLHTEIKAYLFRIVQNACYDYLKHQVVVENYVNKIYAELKKEELKWYNSNDNDILSDETLRKIYLAINKLPDRCREIFTKAYLDQEKYADIAETFHISIRTVETQVYKALRSIRNSLTKLSLFIFLFFS